MLVGHGLFSGLTALAFGAAGSSLLGPAQRVRVMLMGINMPCRWSLWMTFRGHSALRNVEMAASMLVRAWQRPRLGRPSARWPGSAPHAVMVPAMLGVVLWRYDEYAHPHPG